MGRLHLKNYPVIDNLTVLKLKLKKYLKDTAHNIPPAKCLKYKIKQKSTLIPSPAP